MELFDGTRKLLIRPLCKSDYSSYLEVLSELTQVGNVSQEQFEDFVDSLHDKHLVEVIESNGQIIACATLVIEQKLIHEYSKYGHIEDVVVRSSHRGMGLGRILILRMMWMAKGCYKVLLNCSDKNVEFYQKCSFRRNGVSMMARL